MKSKKGNNASDSSTGADSFHKMKAKSKSNKSKNVKPKHKTKNLRKRTHSSLTASSSSHSKSTSQSHESLTGKPVSAHMNMTHIAEIALTATMHNGETLTHTHTHTHLSAASQPTQTPTTSTTYPHNHNHYLSSSSTSAAANIRNRLSSSNKHNKKKRTPQSERLHKHRSSNTSSSSSTTRGQRYKQIKSKQGPSKEKIQQYKKNLYSDDINKQLHAVSQLRILLSDEQQPPIEAVIRANCVPRLIHILRSRESINLLFETAWVLTNICSGSHDHTMAVVEANGIECILDLLDINDIAVLEQSIWVLGNIAGDGTNARDICLEKGVLTRLIKLANEQTKLRTFSTKVPPERRQNAHNENINMNMDIPTSNGSSQLPALPPKPLDPTALFSNNGIGVDNAAAASAYCTSNISSVIDMPLSFQRNFVWTISNLVRGKPQPSWSKVSCVIPIILLYLNCTDLEVLTDTCWALSYLSDGCNDHIQSILDLSLVSDIDISSYLVRFLDKKSMNVLVPALRTCGNIVSGSDHQTQQIIDRGLLTKLKRLLRHPHHSVKKEAIWTVSNITAGNPVQIQAVIDHGLIEPLVDILTDPQADHDLVKECIWAISNATTGGTHAQLRYLSQFASIGLSRVMSHFPCDKKLQLVLLEGLDNLLSFTTANPIPLSESPLVTALLRHRDSYRDRRRKTKASVNIHASMAAKRQAVLNHAVAGDGDDDDDDEKRFELVLSKNSKEQWPHLSPKLAKLIDYELNKNENSSNAQKREYSNGVGGGHDDDDKEALYEPKPKQQRIIDYHEQTSEYKDIYDIQGSEESEDDDFLMSDGYDMDTVNSNQNYVAYIMEQTDAHRILEDWFYDKQQDTDVAQLAKSIYTKYFNEPFQF
eukprot:CAMPEP_0202691466 /NCGR_PEP_ID=MMETSP1385-20130828/6176_1 /ASSEMBLY_ACC=CAM_ASM_000861 /TAXON_ID=933848 /ORGANISM="Elphidium margaritaceum" /LENGTH=875 /DNA_ID=CAMNT_0049346877 /DNA_START=251 /DNA_END=2878 /DNA_ORIENTATION=+